MISKLILAGAAILAVTPAAATLFWPAANEDATLRSVAISGPILGFTQTRDRIQIRLMPSAAGNEADGRKQVIITDKDGDKVAIPLKRGQTWASAELPASLSDAKALDVRVE